MSHPEDLLITALIKSADSKIMAKHGMSSDLFVLRQHEFKWIEKYIARHGALPSRAAYKTKFPDAPFYRTAEGGDVENFIEEVKQNFARYRLTEIMDNSIELLMMGQIDNAVSSLGTELLQVQAVVADMPDDYNTALDWGDTYDDVMARIERVKTTGSAGIPTGFDSLDAETGGLQPGWLSIFAARTGVGKTWTGVRMGCEAAMNGYTALYFTLEQSRHQIAMRSHNFLSKHYGGSIFHAGDLMRGFGFDLLEYKDFLQQLADELPGSLVINDGRRGRVTPMTVAGAIERVQPDIVYVDYLTLMGMEGDGGWQSVGKLSTDLKQIAERFQVPIVAMSQLNRTGEVSRADSISHDSDLVIKLSKKSRHVMKMFMEKFRHGDDGFSWLCEYNPGNGTHDEITPAEADTLIEADDEVD